MPRSHSVRIAAALAVAVECAACHDGNRPASGEMNDSASGYVATPPDTGLPTPPHILIDTRYVQPSAGARRIAVGRGGDLQRALDDARSGDVIMLDAGATYVGNFVLPAKSGSSWITIRTSASDADLPAEGTRVTPGSAPRLARLVSPNDEPVLRTAPSAHNYRLVGLEITAALTVTRSTALVALGGDRRSQRALADVPHHIVIDRSYVHGHDALKVKRCIAMNSAFTAVIDSYISGCHDTDFDSQAIAGWNGPGPFKIVDNYLEGAGENVMFGGGDPGIHGLVPSDIEIRRNHFFKPLAWRNVWRVKNLFELKNAQRVLVEGNVFENCWAAAQAGFAIALKSENQDGSAPWSVTRNVTIRYNKILNVAGGIDIMGTGTNVDEPANRILIEDNVFRVGGSELGDLGRLWQLVEDPSDITFDHNTGFAPKAVLVLDIRQKPFVTIRNNIVGGGQYGIVGSDVGEGQRAIDFYLPHSVVTHNVFIGGDQQSYPRDSYVLRTPSDVGFIDFANANYRLGKSSPNAHLATDGRVVGADIDAVEKATKGAVLGGAGATYAHAR